MKLAVSVQTYNEIASLLEKEGYKVDARPITLEKGIDLVPPIDYRLVTIRRDCVIEATKIYSSYKHNDFIELADSIYQYVLNEIKPFPQPLIIPKGYEVLENE